jgi:hypothetical protein
MSHAAVDENMGEDTTIRVPKDLADDLYNRKGREMSYAEFVRELVDLYDAVEAGELEPDPDPDSVISPDPETAAADMTDAGADTSDLGENIDPDSLEDLGVPELNTVYDALSGEDPVLTRRVNTIVDMYHLLKREGNAQKSDMLEIVDDAAELSYQDTDSVWSNMVKGTDSLRALPGVEPPESGRSVWRYTGDE